MTAGVANDRHARPIGRRLNASWRRRSPTPRSARTVLWMLGRIGSPSRTAAPLAAHVADWNAALTAKGVTAKQVRMLIRRTEALLARVKAERLADLSGAAVQTAIGGLNGEGQKPANVPALPARDQTIQPVGSPGRPNVERCASAPQRIQHSNGPAVRTSPARCRRIAMADRGGGAGAGLSRHGWRRTGDLVPGGLGDRVSRRRATEPQSASIPPRRRSAGHCATRRKEQAAARGRAAYPVRSCGVVAALDRRQALRCSGVCGDARENRE